MTLGHIHLMAAHARMHIATCAKARLNVSAICLAKLDEWEPLWDVYGTAHHNFTRRRAYMIGVGNHEAWYNWTALTHRYPMRQMNAGAAVKAQARPPFWYTFESGGVHWTMLSSEHDYAEGSPQHAFAKSVGAEFEVVESKSLAANAPNNLHRIERP